MSSELHTCSECGHQAKAYYQRVSPGIVHALMKFREAINYHGRNRIHLYKDMDDYIFSLTTSEQMNWTKLRFHGLVAKVKVDGVTQRGYWLLTARGASFLRGDVSIPQKVKTLNNRVIDHDAMLVTISEVLGTVPYFDDIDAIEYEVQPLNMLQARLV